MNEYKDLFHREEHHEFPSKPLFRYSIENTIPIALQRPDATHAAGYNAWRDKFGRQVIKAEHAIDSKYYLLDSLESDLKGKAPSSVVAEPGMASANCLHGH